MEWERRKLQIIKEILIYDCDVICLQEVDHFEFTAPLLEAAGYGALFLPKPDSPALYVTDSRGPDGCAMFYKRSRLELLKSELLVLEDALRSGFTNQVAILCSFGLQCPREAESRRVSVATTHLKAKSGFEKVRHGQGLWLLQKLQDLVKEEPLVVTGDFNAEVNEPVYQAFTNSDLGLKSCYTTLTPAGEEPSYTTWKFRGNGTRIKEYKRCIDYIWYTEDKVRVMAMTNIPSGDDLGAGRLPSLTYPSDHLSLAAEFVLQ